MPTSDAFVFQTALSLVFAQQSVVHWKGESKQKESSSCWFPPRRRDSFGILNTKRWSLRSSSFFSLFFSPLLHFFFFWNLQRTKRNRLRARRSPRLMFFSVIEAKSVLSDRRTKMICFYLQFESQGSLKIFVNALSPTFSKPGSLRDLCSVCA